MTATNDDFRVMRLIRDSLAVRGDQGVPPVGFAKLPNRNSRPMMARAASTIKENLQPKPAAIISAGGVESGGTGIPGVRSACRSIPRPLAVHSARDAAPVRAGAASTQYLLSRS